MTAPGRLTRLQKWLVLGLACVATAVLNPPTALAQTGADKAAAEALFEQARKLMDQGKYAPACEKFEASQQLDAGLGTLLHLADCYEKANRLASAWGTFEEAASLARSRGESERAQIAAVRAAALKPQLIRVMIKVPLTAPKNLEVRRNGRIVPEASYGVPVPVDEGVWKVTASAPGYQRYEVTLEVRAGSPEAYVVNIPELAEEPPMPPQSNAQTPVVQTPTAPPRSAPPPAQNSGEHHSGDTQRTWGLILGGAGAVSAVVSGVFTFMAHKSNQDSQEHCGDRDGVDANECRPKGKEFRDEALDRAKVATVTGVLGALSLGAGATLYFTAPAEAEAPLGSAFGIGLKGVW